MPKYLFKHCFWACLWRCLNLWAQLESSGIIQPTEGLNRTKKTEGENSVSAWLKELEHQSLVFGPPVLLVLRPLDLDGNLYLGLSWVGLHLADGRLQNFSMWEINHMNHFLIINLVIICHISLHLSIYLSIYDISYWFCFSGNPWLIQDPWPVQWWDDWMRGWGMKEGGELMTCITFQSWCLGGICCHKKKNSVGGPEWAYIYTLVAKLA